MRWGVLGAVVGLLTLCWAVASAVVPCTPRGAATAILGLCLPADTETNWGNAIRGNFSALDALFTGASLLKPLNGGTGINGSAAANGTVLIGNGTGYTLATIQSGTGILITNTAGGITVASSGSPAGGSIFAAGTLTASGTNYTTSSATFVDVDGTNLKATVTVPGGAKFLIVQATVCVDSTTITDSLNRIQILAAGTAVAPFVYTNTGAIAIEGAYTAYGVVSNPPSGSQTIALQYRGDGSNSFTIIAQSVEGIGRQCRPRLLYQVTN
jgi:hypothetical protein